MLPSAVVAEVVVPAVVLVVLVAAVAAVAALRQHDAGPVESSIVPDLGPLPSGVLGPDEKTTQTTPQFYTATATGIFSFTN